ncbi:MAG: 16S rRNA processing protein RimM [Desulfobacterales bacterium]|nr:16S rRNA processing protein RimM [Desulfobacterales bacterium]
MKLLNDCNEEKDLLPIGKITGVHGIKGDIKVYSYAESLTSFESVIAIDGPILLRDSTGFESHFTAIRVKPHQQKILLSLKEITNRNMAQSLVGAEIIISPANLPELEDGTYYWFELIGLDVFTTDDIYIGRVESIIPTGSNDVYVVKNPDEKIDTETLIPALKSIVLSIDLAQNKITVDLPEGL